MTCETELSRAAVLVAADFGAVKLVEHYGRLLRLLVAVVRRTRVCGTQVLAEDLVGRVAERPAVIIDDVISTAGTVETAVRVLLAHGAIADITVAVTHALLVGGAWLGGGPC